MSISPTDEDLEQWRLEEFQRMGFYEWQASLLANLNVDTHEMDDLLAKGCPRTLALQILLP